jgi:predicted ATPase
MDAKNLYIIAGCNGEGKHELIAEKSGDSAIIALSFDKYQQFKQSYEKTT